MACRGLLAGLDKGLVEGIAARAPADMHGAVIAPPALFAAMGMLETLEVGQDMTEAPALGALRLPGIEIPRVTPDIDHAVD